MSSKYDELSGYPVQTVTAFGLLTDIILKDKVTIFINKETRSYSLDGIFWTELNLGLFKELVKYSEWGCDNIKIVKKGEEK